MISTYSFSKISELKKELASKKISLKSAHSLLDREEAQTSKSVLTSSKMDLGLRFTEAHNIEIKLHTEPSPLVRKYLRVRSVGFSKLRTPRCTS